MSGLILPVLLGAGVSLVCMLVIVLVLAALILGSVLPASCPSILLSACAGLCTFIGSRFSIQRGSHAPMIAGPLTAVVVCLFMIMICMGGREGVAFHASFAGTLLMVLAGGCLAGLFGKKKRKAKKKKK